MQAEPARRHLPVERPGTAGLFAAALLSRGLAAPVRSRVTTLQVNVGKRCNLACRHCHVDAGPNRTESLSRDVAERIIALLDASPSVRTLDLTGGAPELCESFRYLVTEARQRGLEVIDRCNLAILLEEGMEGLAQFLADRRVHIVASLPCYTQENVDRQRGRGAFDKSLRALWLLGSLGYGRVQGRELDLVYNPLGPSLPPPQEKLERDYRERLRSEFGIEFDRLLTITNMPINRFAHDLERSGQREAYMHLLNEHFNAATLPGLMCRSLVSVDYRGDLYDCDFNQVLGVGLGSARGNGARGIWGIRSLEELGGDAIATADHCLGCTAGAGSSCTGALAEAVAR